MCAPTSSRWAGLVWAVKLTATGAVVLVSIALMARVSGIASVLLAVAATAGVMTPVLWAGWWIGRPARRVPPRVAVTAQPAQSATVRLMPTMPAQPVEPAMVRVVVEPSAVFVPDPAQIGRPMRVLPAPVPPRRHVADRRAVR
jgi:hypothetical protein